MPAHFTLIEGAEVFDPRARGKVAVLIAGGKIIKIGDIDRAPLEASGLGVEVVDANGMLLLPGFIDPHEHLIGGSGENGGFASQTPEIALHELIEGGITTVVGCLGVDTSTRTMPALLAKVKALNEEGITAYLYTGGYNVPSTTLTGSIRTDLLYCSEVIGAGEVAIADVRSTQPTTHALAVTVADTYVGGLLSAKAGVTHFHVGDGRHRLRQLNELLDDFDIKPESLYATHVERTHALVAEAAKLTKRGATVDMDTVDEDLGQWAKIYLQEGGLPERLTASSDAAINAPSNLYLQFVDCVHNHGFSIEQILPVFTSNTAQTLKLHQKGKIGIDLDADILLVDKRSLAISWVFARGRRLMQNGTVCATPLFLQKSNRRIQLNGKKTR